MYPDLIARTCGYLGVFIALIVMGILGEPEFAVTPQQSFDRITLSLHVLEAEAATTKDQKQEPPEPTPAPEPEPEPQTEPEPEPTPQPEEPPVTEPTEPVEPELSPKAEPIPAPEVVKEPEPTPPPTQVQTTPAPKEEQPKAESKPKAPEKAVDKPKPAPQTKPKPQQPKPRATTTTQNKAKPQTTAAKKAPAAPAAATTTADNDRQLRSQLSSLLVREIRAQLKYPRNAVRRKLEGTVMMEFEVKNGVVVGFVLRQSSGHKILDEAARKLAQKLVQFNTRLGAMNYRVQIPIKYELL